MREFAVVSQHDQPLDTYEVNKLATYNAEVARGVQHSSEWRARMAILQERFNTVGYVTEHKRWWQR